MGLKIGEILRLAALFTSLSAMIACGDMNPTGPSFSSAKIAYTANWDNGTVEIHVMNADGNGQTRLTNSAASGPVWSPNGTKIAFTSNRDGNREVYVMNADGTHQTRLTNSAAIDYAPSWSPDGIKIAFASNRDGNYEIYVMNADGSTQRRLTNSADDEEGPVWSLR